VTILDRVVERLDARGIPTAVIGATALAAHGVSRSTFDRDLLTSHATVLDPSFWKDFPPDAGVDARRGETSDPLVGVVRFTSSHDRDVDLVVIAGAWIDAILARASEAPMPIPSMRVVQPADLILLKLYAGGAQDRWDIEQLLALDSDGGIRRLVDARVGDLPARCAVLWREMA
jgi:hypothetical protein